MSRLTSTVGRSAVLVCRRAEPPILFNVATAPERLGLRGLLEQMQATAGREVNIMIFRSPEAAIGRSESIIVP